MFFSSFFFFKESTYCVYILEYLITDRYDTHKLTLKRRKAYSLYKVSIVPTLSFKLNRNEIVFLFFLHSGLEIVEKSGAGDYDEVLLIFFFFFQN